ncbi:MAG: HAD family hydrolase [Waddliaceae bacterium]
MRTKSQTIAAFDFDGTLSYRDTLFFFLLYAKGPIKTFCYLLSHIHVLAAFLLGKMSHQETKERILKKFFKGESIEKVKEKGRAFALERLSSHLRPEGLKRIRWHLDQGHRCIIVSASLDVYLQPWAMSMGFHDVVSSRLEVTKEGKATGYLDGENCRGAEKIRRLTELLGGPLENYCLYAYGDSEGDKELLEAADYPFYRTMPTESSG